MERDAGLDSFAAKACPLLQPLLPLRRAADNLQTIAIACEQATALARRLKLLHLATWC